MNILALFDRRCGLLLPLLPWLLLACQAQAANDDYTDAIDFYRNGQYEQAQKLLEQAVEQQPSSENYHWLGKTYGRLADQSGLFRTLSLARKTGAALEQAVRLDHSNREAIEDLIKFHEQAPGFVGGDPARAEELRDMLEQHAHSGH